MTRSIDAYSLRLFLAVATEGSIARGAAKEHIAASALSRRLSELEHALGVALFVRSHRGIQLTGAGQIVLERGTKIESELRQLKQDVKEVEGVVSGTVRLAANLSSIIGFLPERLHLYTDMFPQVNVALTEQDSQDVVRSCLDDEADVGVGVKLDAPPAIESWCIVSDPLLVVLPVTHALADERSIAFSQALSYRLIGVHPGGSLDLQLRRQAQAMGSRVDFAVQVSSFDAACRMIEAGLGIAIMPRSAAKAYAGTRKFARRPLAEPWASPRELWGYALRKTPRLRAVQALIDALQY
ncbi:MAG TPA: LysR family transcriptional regulator [Pusillimonas sp.]